MSDQQDKDYEVGYGKPPIHTQWKPGQSGNPAGRPPRSRNTKRLLQELLDEPIEVTENGEKLQVTKGEAVLRRLIADGLNGNPRAQKLLLETLAKYSRKFDS